MVMLAAADDSTFLSHHLVLRTPNKPTKFKQACGVYFIFIDFRVMINSEKLHALGNRCYILIHIYAIILYFVILSVVENVLVLGNRVGIRI